MKKKSIKTGYYARLEWPNGKPTIDQSYILHNIFMIIKNELMKIS